ncbi:hypothetical protein QA601_15675 [Chitinispirillales bacterium ANBcel5]|uniref:hypothetical protein n=1 Tax=Cellulosispirillum alkaliphilum TaxID=3039283 RepID=UPI002A52BF0C|nr:hypothetical protein [Chitinispirillales bacterium ANBcel5]
MQKQMAMLSVIIALLLHAVYSDALKGVDTLELGQGIIFGSNDITIDYPDLYFYDGNSCDAECCQPALRVGAPVAIYRSTQSKEYYDFKDELDLDNEVLFDHGMPSPYHDELKSIGMVLFAETGCSSDRQLFEDQYYVIITPDSNYVKAEIRYIPVMCYDVPDVGCVSGQAWVVTPKIEVSWTMEEEKKPHFPSLIPMSAGPQRQLRSRNQQVPSNRNAVQAFTITGRKVDINQTISKQNVLIIRDAHGNYRKVFGDRWQAELNNR